MLCTYVGAPAATVTYSVDNADKTEHTAPTGTGVTTLHTGASAALYGVVVADTLIGHVISWYEGGVYMSSEDIGLAPDVAAIKAKTDTIGSGTVSVVSAVHTDGTWGPLVAGDDYAGTRALYVTTDADLSDVDPATGVVCNFGSVLPGVACVVTGPVDGDYTVTITHLTAAQTAGILGIVTREFEATDSDGYKTTFGRSSVQFVADAP